MGSMSAVLASWRERKLAGIKVSGGLNLPTIGLPQMTHMSTRILETVQVKQESTQNNIAVVMIYTPKESCTVSSKSKKL